MLFVPYLTMAGDSKTSWKKRLSSFALVFHSFLAKKWVIMLADKKEKWPT